MSQAAVSQMACHVSPQVVALLYFVECVVRPSSIRLSRNWCTTFRLREILIQVLDVHFQSLALTPKRSSPTSVQVPRTCTVVPCGTAGVPKPQRWLAAFPHRSLSSTISLILLGSNRPITIAAGRYKYLFIWNNISQVLDVPPKSTAPTKRSQSQRVKPSLRDKHYPGWTVTQYPSHVVMQEHGTGCSYTIPVARFNKAAAGLLKRGISTSMGSPKSICRCTRRCATSFSVETLLCLRHWFFQHATHDEAVVELAKRMCASMRQYARMYVISDRQVIKNTAPCLTLTGLSTIFRFCVWL